MTLKFVTVGLLISSGLIANAQASNNTFSALSSEGQTTCTFLTSPASLVYANLRDQMIEEASESAKDACRNAGFDVCEVVSVNLTTAPAQSGINACFEIARVKGGNSPK